MSKILLISPQPFFEWRGSPIRVGFDALALAELGNSVDLLVLPVGKDREIPGVRVVRVPNVFRVRRVPIGPSLVKLAFDVLLFFKALGLARKERYDVIHGIEDAGLIALLIARITGARCIFEKHSDPSSYRKGCFRNMLMHVYSGVERFVARNCDAVIGTGPGLAKQAVAAGGRGTVHHVPDLPSSLKESSPESAGRIRERLLSGCDDGVLITFVGSFAVYQGVDLLFAAMPIVAAANGRARFVVIGGRPMEIEERAAELREKDVGVWIAGNGSGAVPGSERVLFLGKIPPDDLPDYLCASDVLLSPRTAGVNTPLKLLDYLKAGRAIVATDCTANRLILDDENALLAPAEPAGFADGIGRLVDDAPLREKLGGMGRRLVDETYNFSEFKSKLGDCYGGLQEQ